MTEYVLFAVVYLVGYAVGHTRALAATAADKARDKSIHVYVDNSQHYDAEGEDDSESWKRGGRPGLN